MDQSRDTPDERINGATGPADTSQPFTMNHRQGASSRVDLSFLLDPPAGRDGFVTVDGGHLVTPNGARLRLWGVNVTDWTPGSVIIPAKHDAPIYAATLARFGVNCVRLHFLDLPTPRGLIDATRPTPRIEPVSGRITLRNLAGATTVWAQALDGAGAPLGAALPATRTPTGWVIPIGAPATTWYEIVIER